MSDLSDHERGILRHTLGAEPHIKRSRHGYRNHYCTEVGTNTFTTLLSMQSRGYMVCGMVINDGSCQYFHATVEGAVEIGLHTAALKRAFSNYRRPKPCPK